MVRGDGCFRRGMILTILIPKVDAIPPQLDRWSCLLMSCGGLWLVPVPLGADYSTARVEHLQDPPLCQMDRTPAWCVLLYKAGGRTTTASIALEIAPRRRRNTPAEWEVSERPLDPSRSTALCSTALCSTALCSTALFSTALFSNAPPLRAAPPRSTEQWSQRCESWFMTGKWTISKNVSMLLSPIILVSY